ncbi:MAG: hypothetical protein SPI30_05765 [Prevotella sp.]|nr:hypothetical protein [Prevotella sp.]
MKSLRYGIDTSHWYTLYQRLVRSIPVLGSVSTTHWYDDETCPNRNISGNGSPHDGKES